MGPVSLRTILDSLLRSLPTTRPLPQDALDRIVTETLGSSASINIETKLDWENVLRADIYTLTDKRDSVYQSDEVGYHKELYDRLDLVLVLSEKGFCDPNFSLTILQDLFESHPIKSCVHIFNWLELRSARALVDIVAHKKSLAVIKLLNDLVRRVTKTGTGAAFRGRILDFLSRQFPLGERSGVNLRGEYAPPWEPVSLSSSKEGVSGTSTVEGNGHSTENLEPSKTKPATSNSNSTTTDKVDGTSTSTTTSNPNPTPFYDTFWFLQTPFSQPQTFSTDPNAMSSFKAAVETILPVIQEATRKERLSAAARSSGAAGVIAEAGVKRKRDDEAESAIRPSENAMDYLFSKFLTGSDVLDLQLADLHFRRQILTQLLILFNHLLTFTQPEKDKWYTPRNRSLQMDFTLNDTDAKWIKEMWGKVSEELKAPTAGLGGTNAAHRMFQETVIALLERERNWIRWKNEMCEPFDKPPLDPSELVTAREKRRKFLEPIPDLAHAFGTEDLTDVWENGYRGPDDLSRPPKHVSLERYVRDAKAMDKKIEMKKKQLEMARLRKVATASNNPTGNSTSAISSSPFKSKTEASVTPSSSQGSTAPAPAPVPVMSTPPLTPFPGHGLPPKPGSVVPATPPPRRATPTPAPVSEPVTPAKPAEAAEPEKPEPPQPLTDAQLQGFEEQREINLWRALRIAAQEGHLHCFGKANHLTPGAGNKGKELALGDIAGLLEIIKSSPPPPPPPTPKPQALTASAKRAGGATTKVEGAPEEAMDVDDTKMDEAKPTVSVEEDDDDDGVPDEVFVQAVSVRTEPAVVTAMEVDA